MGGARHLRILGGLVLLLLGASLQLVEAHRPQPPQDGSEAVRLSLQPRGSFVQAARAHGSPDVQDDTTREEAKAAEGKEIRTVEHRMDKIEKRLGEVEEEVEVPDEKSNGTAGEQKEDDLSDDESEENEMAKRKDKAAKEHHPGKMEKNKAIQHEKMIKGGHVGRHLQGIGSHITSFFDIVHWTDDEVRMVATTTAILLMFFVAFIMVIVYMLNFPDEQVQSLSYKLVSTCIAILCAVLIEKAQFGKFCSLIVLGVILGEDLHDIQSEMVLLAVNLVFFLIWFALLSVMMKRSVPKHENFYAIRLFVAHEIAFVGIHMFAGPQQRFGQSNFKRGLPHWAVILLQFVFVVGVSVFCGAFSYLAMRARGGQAHSDEHHERPQHGEELQHDEGRSNEAHSDEHHESPQHGEELQHDEGRSNEDAQHSLGGQHGDDHEVAAQQGAQHDAHHDHQEGGSHHGDDHHHVFSELWKVEASEGEDEAAAILLSFLTRQAFLLVITGRVATPKGDFGEHTSEDFGALFSLILAVLITLLLVTKFLEAKMPRPHGHHVPTIAARASEFTVQYFAFLVGWLSLSLCRWMMQRIMREKTLMFIGVAAWVSFPLILLIIAVDFLCDEGWLKDSTALVFIECSGLVIGISWEKAFAMAIDTINHAHSGSTPAYVITEIGLCVGLCLLLMPGWRWFICPTACQPVPKRKTQEELAAEKLRAAIGSTRKGRVAHSETDSDGSVDNAGPGAAGGNARGPGSAEPRPSVPRQVPEASGGSAGGNARNPGSAEPRLSALTPVPEASRESAGPAAGAENVKPEASAAESSQAER